MNGFDAALQGTSQFATFALRQAIFAGLAAGMLLAVVAAINLLGRRWLSASQMGLLWGIVLIRLLIPVAPASSWSLQNVLSVHPVESPAPRSAGPAAATMGYASPASIANAATGSAQPVALPAALPVDPLPVVVARGAIELVLESLPLLWLLGGAASAAATIIAHGRLSLRIRRAPPCQDQRLLGLWEACCQRAGVRVRIPLHLFDGVQQPAVMELFRPQLLLPTDAAELSDNQLRMVMLHELAHVRRWDIAGNWLLVAIRAIHWWNPVYWIAASRYRNLREQACDAFVIQQLEDQPTRGYSELLLALAQRQPAGPFWRVTLPASMLGFLSSFFRKRAVRGRLTALRFAGRTPGRWQQAAMAGLLMVVAVAGLTDASPPATPAAPPSDWLSQPGHDWNNWQGAIKTGPRPLVTRSYDLEKALERIAADRPTNDDPLPLIRGLLTHLLRTGRSHDAVPADAYVAEQFVLEGPALTVTAPLEVQTAISNCLQAWEQSGLGQISVEIRFLSTEDDIASAAGISWEYLEAFSTDSVEAFPITSETGRPVIRAKAAVDEYLPVAVATLNSQQATALLQTAQSERSSNVMQAPKITLFNGQQAAVFDRTQSPFVVGMLDVVAGDQQPKIAIIDEGFKLDLRAIQASDAASVQLEARIELSHIDEVRTATTLVRGTPTTIQIPRVKRCRIDASSKVADGQSLLIGCIPTFEQSKYFYVVLTVRNIPEPAADGP